MKLRHAMPFGAELRADGTRFRLWAPAAPAVTLCLFDGERERALPMRREPDGWFAAHWPKRQPGLRYGFRLGDGPLLPDPASRRNPDDVHGASEVCDPLAFDWPLAPWRGRPWHEAVIYELHIGAFTPQGTFLAAIERLDYLHELGVTALEIMPIAEFPGACNWGYDGVLPFAPEASYGTPEDFKRLVLAAQARGMMVLLDVVYNHFGPEGNYLHFYAPQFFHATRTTPWGAALDFEGARTVREFFVHNALYWVEEFRLDGLRLDAVHAITDASQPDLVSEIASRLREGPGRMRHVHLVLENDANQARYLERGAAGPLCATAQWNDDYHHALHVLLTGEQARYYVDYSEQPQEYLARALAEGFAYQGETSRHRDGAWRGEPSAHLPPQAFVNFLQSHDQVGNRAEGERLAVLAPLERLPLAIATTLLAPSIPLLFMGEEFAARTPFLFFCDFGPELAAAVRAGRAQEHQEDVPPEWLDPTSPAAFAASKLDWGALERSPHREMLDFHRRMLELRRRLLVPHLSGLAHGGRAQVTPANVLEVCWQLGDGARLHLAANFSANLVPCDDVAIGRVILTIGRVAPDTLGPWSGRWRLETSPARGAGHA
ncbi:MAG: malto-oligosyltrehalose trehalohydrolase [Gammaproteobacteria bacterium]